MSTLTRQLLPCDADMKAGARLMARQFRWVTWVAEPVTRGEAAAHLWLAGSDGGVVVQVVRGPKGGWTGAVFRRPRNAMPPKWKADTTWYYGWEHSRSHPKDWMPPDEQWRATLVLYART